MTTDPRVTATTERIVSSTAPAVDQMKLIPDDEDEIRDVLVFTETNQNHVTPVAQWPAEVAQAIVDGLAAIVRAGHVSQPANTPDADGIVRAQLFEEGDVYMLDSPFDGYFADRYLMDFYDVDQRDICSRMHIHTGLRFVRMMTGVDTRIRVSSLSPFSITNVPGVTPFQPQCFEDDLPELPEGERRTRYNLVVPPCSWVDMQVPRGQSHQFNALGPNAVIDSVHPEESIEIFRENMRGYRMMAQTVFLAEERPAASTCDQLPAELATP
jgi:hypothetical protein